MKDVHTFKCLLQELLKDNVRNVDKMTEKSFSLNVGLAANVFVFKATEDNLLLNLKKGQTGWGIWKVLQDSLTHCWL